VSKYFVQHRRLAVKVAEQRVLVYELHITNFEVVPLTLKASRNIRGRGEKEPLKVWREMCYRRP